MAVVSVGLALVLVGFVSSAGARGDDPYAYLTGVYWFDGEFYQTDITCWNVPGNPQGGLVWLIKMYPGGVDAAAPEGWEGYADEDNVDWVTSWAHEEYMIPPGESLSGFILTTDYDPGRVSFGYGIHMNEGDGGYGEFTPEYVPEPWLAGPLFFAVVATWETLRRRRQ